METLDILLDQRQALNIKLDNNQISLSDYMSQMKVINDKISIICSKS